MKKVGTLRIEQEKAVQIWRLLADTELIRPAVPGTVGLRGDTITIMFRKLFIRFQDNYRLEISASQPGNEITIVFRGERSRITISYRVSGDAIEVYTDYEGPRRLIVRGQVKTIAMSILRHVLAELSRRKEEPKQVPRGRGTDYSTLLKDPSRLIKMLMKSMLVYSREIRAENGIYEVIEHLRSQGIFNKYDHVYVTGSTSDGRISFRLLFVNGSLAGVYANVNGEEKHGDPWIISGAPGIYSVKVYSVMPQGLEVLKE